MEESTQNGNASSTAVPSSPDTPAPIKVNLGDGAVIKHVLDEHAARVTKHSSQRHACSRAVLLASSLTLMHALSTVASACVSCCARLVTARM